MTLDMRPGRVLHPDEPVRVYRNLHAGRRTSLVVYSVVQRGVVIAHTSDLWLTQAEFIVQQSGRRRVLQTGRKNVHAFVVGYVTEERVIETPRYLIWYNPRDFIYFTTHIAGEVKSVHSAEIVRCGDHGLEAWALGRTGRAERST